MQVKVRYVDDSYGALFEEIPFTALDELIGFVKRSSGFYYNGNQEQFHSYQLVHDSDEVYCEIIIGDDGND